MNKMASDRLAQVENPASRVCRLMVVPFMHESPTFLLKTHAHTHTKQTHTNRAAAEQKKVMLASIYWEGFIDIQHGLI